MKPDDLIEALVVRCGEISPRWTECFPAIPQGYRKLQRLISRYGYGNVRDALEWVIAFQVKPDNAMGVLTARLNFKAKVEDVPVQEGML
ncbi:MAG TPA: hypothetical protein VFQ40_04820 [Actinomycetota bacterium]|nr:hypothetical protein [Actinomycetota bacterium]